MKLYTLLAATDFSVASRRSALRAAMLSRQIKARLELVHVLKKKAIDELQQLLDQDSETLQKIRSQARKELSREAGRIAEPLGTNAGWHLMEGEVLRSIMARADTLDAGLLIVGAHGTGGYVRQLILGSTTERLLRMTTRPVLTVKQPPRNAYRSVLVPIDFSPCSQNAIRLALAFAPQAKLILLHAYEVPFEGKMRIAGAKEEEIQRFREIVREKTDARLHQAASDAGITTTDWHSIVVRGNTVSCILEQEEKQGADLIVLGKHGLSMVEELLLGGHAKHILAQAHCDVLIATNNC